VAQSGKEADRTTASATASESSPTQWLLFPIHNDEHCVTEDGHAVAQSSSMQCLLFLACHQTSMVSLIALFQAAYASLPLPMYFAQSLLPGIKRSSVKYDRFDTKPQKLPVNIDFIDV
jgi:hypothetical protein